jgi:hypothetical protein
VLGLPAVTAVLLTAAVTGYRNRRIPINDRSRRTGHVAWLVAVIVVLLFSVPAVLLISRPALLAAIIAVFLLVVPFGLIPALVWFGADFADVDEALVMSVIEGIGRRLQPWASVAASTALAAVTLTWLIAQRGIILGDSHPGRRPGLDQLGAIGSAVEAVTIAAMAVALVSSLGLSLDKKRLPPWPLVLAAIASVVALLEPIALAGFLAVGLVLSWVARRRPSLAGPALFMVIVALLTLATDAPAGLLPFTVEWLPNLGLSGIQAGVAFGTLCWLVAMAVRKTSIDKAASRLTSLAALNLGLIGLRLIVDLFDRSIAAGRSSSLLLGLFLVVAIGWELATSGEVTNNDTRTWPRSARIYLFVAYIILVTDCVVFLTTASGGTLTRLESEGFTEFGMTVLGSSLLVTHFLAKTLGVYVHRVPRQRRAIAGHTG